MRIEPRQRPTTDPEPSFEPSRAPAPPRSDHGLLVGPRDTPERLAFFAGLRAQVSRVDAASAAPPRDAIVGARLDAFRDALSGPYTVEGQTVTARPMFRMNGGMNEASAKQHAGALRSILAKAGVHGELVRLGQGEPRDLVRATQALIDAGHLPPPPGDVATRIRQMQWTWGIGIDCAGYTYQAAVAASGANPSALGLKPRGFENFRALDANRAFAKVSPTAARPGDVMTLDPKPPETVGHNVIVRSHTTVGTRHVIEVDSSWGAGAEGADYGGFRRDTWIYDEATQLWTSFDLRVSPPAERVSREGPADERCHGCYRPKVGT